MGFTRRGVLGLLAASAVPAWGGEPLRVVDAAGAERTVAALAGGEPALVHLWATWCAPCRVELPRLAAFLHENPALARRIIVVSVDKAPFAKVAAFLADDLDAPMRTYKVSGGNPGLVYGVTGYPTTLFLDGSGAVQERVAGPLDWQAPETLARVQAHLALGGR